MITNLVTQTTSDFAVTVAANTPTQQELDFLVLESHAINKVSQAETQALTQYATKLDSKAKIPDTRIILRQSLTTTIQDGYALGVAHGYSDLAAFGSMVSTVQFAQNIESQIAALDVLLNADTVRQPKTLDKYSQDLKRISQEVNDSNRTDLVGSIESLQDKLNTARIKTGLEPIRRGLVRATKTATNTRDKAPVGISNTDSILARAIEEKIKYLKTQSSTVSNTPPIQLPDDKQFFEWYNRYRIEPIVQRYQNKLNTDGASAREVITQYTQEVNKTTAPDLLKRKYQDKVLKRLLPVETASNDDLSIARDRLRSSPIGRVQRVVITELAVAYNIGRLRAFMQAGIQYVEISTDRERGNKPCMFCLDAAANSITKPIRILDLLTRSDLRRYRTPIKSPANLKYLVFHPFCKCYYVPRPDLKDEASDTQQSPITDANVLKFILGLGLGVGLVYLAFALTNKPLVAKATAQATDILPAPVVGLTDNISRTTLTDDIISENQPLQLPASTRPSVKLNLPDLDLLDLETQDYIDTVTKNTKGTVVDKQFAVLDALQDLPALGKTPAQRTLNKNTKRVLLRNIVDSLTADYNRNAKYYQPQLDVLKQDLEIPGMQYSVKDLNIKKRQLRSIDATFLKSSTTKLETYISQLTDTNNRVVTNTTNRQRDQEFLDELDLSIIQLEALVAKQQRYSDDIASLLRYIDTGLIPATKQLLQTLKIRLDADTVKLQDLTGRLQSGVVVPTAYTDYELFLRDLEIYSQAGGDTKKYQRTVQRLRAVLPPTTYKRYGGLITFGKYT